MIGELIDHYRVLELLGCGAMGVVYKGLDVNLERSVAIKVMGAAACNDPDFVERFRQEARLQGALTHPNIALLFDYFIHEGAPVAVMEFIDGESLEQLIRRRGPVPAHESIPLFRQALLGVGAAHRAGIIHRDLKPSNLMVTKDAIVKVMDFGIAKRQGVTGATKVSTSTSIGSPLYMAPEQILGRAVDCRTDVYALGVTLYELLSGQKPFSPRGKTEYGVLNAHVNDLPEPPTVHCRDIPGPVVDVVLRALAKEPGDRFQSADDFMRALPEVRAPDSATPRADLSSTVALEYSPPVSADSVTTREPRGTMAFEYVPPARRELHESVAFAYSAATLRQESYRPTRPPPVAATRTLSAAANVASAGTTGAARPGDNSIRTSRVPPPAVQGLGGAGPHLMQRLRAHRLAMMAVLVATLLLGTLIRHGQWLHAMRRDASLGSQGPDVTQTQALTPTQAPAQAPTPPEPAPPAAEVPASGSEAAPPTEVAAATAVPATATPVAPTSAATRTDLSGTWRGEYVDGSGKPLLRVVSLSISRVRGDGGIEGTLQYQAASGDGECQLHPRGSSYSAGEQRLQLSPEGCSPHYPKELGVPLDFDGVSPRASVLNDGRIEAPTGAVIRVKLKRVSGI